MTDFIDHMVFVCFAGAAIGISLMLIAGVFHLIDLVSKGKFSEWIIKLFQE